jgi:hypothetical protein
LPIIVLRRRELVITACRHSHVLTNRAPCQDASVPADINNF